VTVLRKIRVEHIGILLVVAAVLYVFYLDSSSSKDLVGETAGAAGGAPECNDRIDNDMDGGCDYISGACGSRPYQYRYTYRCGWRSRCTGYKTYYSPIPADPQCKGQWNGRESIPVCGNGRLEGTEQCDDGNTVDMDGCSNSCAAQVIVPQSTDPSNAVTFTTPAAIDASMHFIVDNHKFVLKVKGLDVAPTWTPDAVHFEITNSESGGVVQVASSYPSGTAPLNSYGPNVQFQYTTYLNTLFPSWYPVRWTPLFVTYDGYTTDRASLKWRLRYYVRIDQTCGNGIVEGTEQCDDWNVVDMDGCSSACQNVCYDSDNSAGLLQPQSFVKGTVIYGTSRYIDTCVGTISVQERYCDVRGLPATYDIGCGPNTCLDGRCITNVTNATNATMPGVGNGTNNTMQMQLFVRGPIWNSTIWNSTYPSNTIPNSTHPMMNMTNSTTTRKMIGDCTGTSPLTCSGVLSDIYPDNIIRGNTHYVFEALTIGAGTIRQLNVTGSMIYLGRYYPQNPRNCDPYYSPHGCNLTIMTSEAYNHYSPANFTVIGVR